MKRVAATAFAACLMLASAVAGAEAQSSLVNGVYVVTVSGTAGGGLVSYDPDSVVKLPALLVVYPPVTADRPAEMCLFINGFPLAFPSITAPAGGSWLASRLGCGSSVAAGAPLTSTTDALVGSVIELEGYDGVFVSAPVDSEREESWRVLENHFLASTGEFQGPWCIITACDPPTKSRNVVSDGWWGAVTFDKGKTVVGFIDLHGVEVGAPLAPSKYRATFEGGLIGRMQ